MQERRWVGDDEARRLREDLLSDALPIRMAGPRTVEVGDMELELPFVQLDASSRPDADDLFRVVAAEGTQAQMASIFRYLLIGDRAYMEINVRLSDPVSCAFKFVLQWPAHRPLFDLMLIQGQLFFSTKDLSPEHQASTLGVKIPRPELEPILDLWRQRLDPGPPRGDRESR